MRLAPLAAATLLLLPRPSLAWGPTVYRAVVQRAVDTLPSPLKGFYKARVQQLPSVAPDGAPPQDSPERRFPADRYLPFPFTDLPRNEADLKAKFGEAAGPGRLPWLVLESYGRLVDAFKSRDEAKILAESDALATPKQAREMLSQSGLAVTPAESLTDAAKKVVAAAKSR